MNSYEIIDEYGYKYSDITSDVIDKALELEGVCNSVFNVILVDEEKIQEINRDYRGKDSVTDVISFALLDGLDKCKMPIKVLGDIYVCIPRMKEQAIKYGHSEVRELSFLIVHGILHLLGYDHMNLEDEKIMMEKQELVLNEFKETKRNVIS